jgi:hydroxymethylpyrimidine/phosphomethylpyrimidine kinase
MTSTAFAHYPRVLSIAGSDSGGGAGIQADIKTISALGGYAMTAITAITAQNTQGVQGIHALPAAFLKSQIQSVADDIGVDAVKIGMLHTPEVVQVVSWAIDHYAWKNVILDPVMVATSGDRLIDEETVQVLIDELFPKVQLITPNLDEAQVLLGRAIENESELLGGAQALLGLGAASVLLKGGHLKGPWVVDVWTSGDEPMVLKCKRIDSQNVHGTGCTLSSAIATHCARGESLKVAIEKARTYILGAITHGAQVQTGDPKGRGHGPLNHGFEPLKMQILR